MATEPRDDHPELHDAPPAHRAPPPQIQNEQLTAFAREQSWLGPLPPPEAFRQYDAVLPGASERILRMAEKDLDSQIERRGKVTQATIDQSGQGLAVAAVLAFVCVAAAVTFFALGHNLAGSVLLGLPVMVMIQSFLSRASKGRPPDEQGSPKQ